jgi:hypothetical protein
MRPKLPETPAKLVSPEQTEGEETGGRNSETPVFRRSFEFRPLPSSSRDDYGGAQ